MPIWAGVLGMVRTTRPMSSPRDRRAMSMPAAMEMAIVCGPTIGCSEVMTLSMICGLTASTSTLGSSPLASELRVRP
ncbi:hypothetical protein D9M68_970400 [compost metagenome]